MFLEYSYVIRSVTLRAVLKCCRGTEGLVLGPMLSLLTLPTGAVTVLGVIVPIKTPRSISLSVTVPANLLSVRPVVAQVSVLGSGARLRIDATPTT